MPKVVLIPQAQQANRNCKIVMNISQERKAYNQIMKVPSWSDFPWKRDVWFKITKIISPPVLKFNEYLTHKITLFVTEFYVLVGIRHTQLIRTEYRPLPLHPCQAECNNISSHHCHGPISLSLSQMKTQTSYQRKASEDHLWKRDQRE